MTTKPHTAPAEALEHTPPTGVVPLRKNPDYLKWYVSDVAADAGNAVRVFAMPLIGLAVTGSLGLAGALGATTGIAGLLALLPGGIAADRHDRRKLLTIGHAIGAVIWGTGVALFFAGLLTTPALFAIAALGGVRSGFFGAVSTPALRQLVHPTQLPRAIAANEARDGVIELGSGPVGGFLVAIAVWVPFATQAIGHAVAWLFTLGIRADMRPRRVNDGETAPTALVQVRQGFAWLRTHRTVTILLVLAAIISLGISGVLQVIILWLADAGEAQTRIGFVSTAMAAGMILGSVMAGPLASRFPTGKLAVAAVVWTAGVLVALVAVRDFGWILVVVGLAAFAVPVFNSAASGWAISQIPNDKMGAITSAAGLLNNLLLPLAPLLAGIGLDAFGYNVMIVVFVAILAAGAIGMAFVREFRELGTPDSWQNES